MTSFDKIRRLYQLKENENFGFTEQDMASLEARLNIQLPKMLREYYLTLGRQENLNYSHNRLLKPDKEIGFSSDRHLIFYEENQVVVFWGIRKDDLSLDNPPVWGNYGTDEEPDWHKETETTDAFFLLMAVYNGTLGGLPFNANALKPVNKETVISIQQNTTRIPEISSNQQVVYTNDFLEMISLSFDKDENCTGIFIGTADAEKFDTMIATLDVDWSYISDEDEDYEDEESLKR